jgi:L,D-peptidoglycan transpeptidase YkuD (ErfK/YbiS/YcfS/YnhG family)
VRRIGSVLVVTAALLTLSGPAEAIRLSDAHVATPETAVTHQRLIDRLVGIHDADQVIAVTASGYGTSYATLRGWRRTAHGWHRTWGPWPARIGYNGFAPRGDKREGDGRTPTGSYHFQFMFGVYSNPGVRFHYRRALKTSYWNDDSQSANYNRWVDSRYDAVGRNPEPMHISPAYIYGAVIGYNLSRTPGKGSAIFLHVSHNSATAGCVSIAQSRVVKVLRWLRPAKHPRIVMGTRAAVTR